MSDPFAWVDALDAPEKVDLDPRVWVEPKTKGDSSEAARQRAVIGFLRKSASRCIVFAVPNAAIGRRDKLRQFNEGAVSGACDLVIAWAGGVAFLEMKDGTSMPRANQVEFLNQMAKRDHHVGVGRSVDGVAAWLHSVGAPVGRVTA